MQLFIIASLFSGSRTYIIFYPFLIKSSSSEMPNNWYIDRSVQVVCDNFYSFFLYVMINFYQTDNPMIVLLLAIHNPRVG